MDTPLIVIGAGIVGAAVAKQAAEAGFQTTLIEAGRPGGGTTGTGMGHLVALDDALLPLAARSLELWREDPALGQFEYRATGTIWVAETETELRGLGDQARHFARHGITTELLHGQELRALEPDLAPDLAGGLLNPSDGILYAPKAVAHWITHAVAAGVRLLVGRRVTALTGDGVRLMDGAHLKGTVVVATGLAGCELVPELPVAPRRGHLVITERAPPTVSHQLVEAGYLAGVHGNEHATVALNVQPRPGGQLLIGSSRESGIRARECSARLIAQMLERAFRFLPVLRAHRAIRIWTGLRPATPDGRPFIGPVPGRPGVWAAFGHEGLGITTAPGTAELVIDGLLGRTPRVDPVPFSPSRILPSP